VLNIVTCVDQIMNSRYICLLSASADHVSFPRYSINWFNW